MPLVDVPAPEPAPSTGKNLEVMPPEIFNRICEMCLVFDAPVEVSHHFLWITNVHTNYRKKRSKHYFMYTVSEMQGKKNRKKNLFLASGISLFRVSKEIRRLTCPIFLANNVFSFKSVTTLAKFVSFKPSVLASMRYIALDAFNPAFQKLPPVPLRLLRNLIRFDITLKKSAPDPTASELMKALKSLFMHDCKAPTQQMAAFEAINLKFGKGARIAFQGSVEFISADTMTPELMKELRDELLMQWAEGMWDPPAGYYDIFPFPEEQKAEIIKANKISLRAFHRSREFLFPGYASR